MSFEAANGGGKANGGGPAQPEPIGPALRRSGRTRNPTDQVTTLEKTTPENLPRIRNRVKTQAVGLGPPPKRRYSAKKIGKRIEEPNEEDLNKPASEEDRSNWEGWCEIESEPAYFHQIIREWGVKGVKIQEVYSMADLGNEIPKPIYGLIFLFQYQADNPEKMEECPDDVWFAQQVAMNSCASVSLLNIIMNVPNVDIGESLAGLKRSTSSDLTPRKRGEVVRDCKFVRVIHNSFALKSDLLNEVIDFNQPVTPKKKPSDSSMRSPRKFKKSKTGRAKKRKTVDEDSAADGAFHFIAFVPINGKVWKLDGMDAQPMNLGPFENNWLDLACDEISSRMKASELVNKTGFSLQAVCCSPLKMLSTLLAENLARLLCVEQILSIKDTDWSAYIDPDSAVASTVNLLGPDGEACVCPELLAEAKSKLDNDENSCPEITKPENTTTDLVNIREKAIGAQTKLCSEYMEELRVVKKDEEQANKRRQEPQDTTGESAQDDTEMLTPRTQEMIAKIDYATSMHDLMQGLVFTKNGRAESPVPVDLHSKVHVGEF